MKNQLTFVLGLTALIAFSGGSSASGYSVTSARGGDGVRPLVLVLKGGGNGAGNGLTGGVERGFASRGKASNGITGGVEKGIISGGVEKGFAAGGIERNIAYGGDGTGI